MEERHYPAPDLARIPPVVDADTHTYLIDPSLGGQTYQLSRAADQVLAVPILTAGSEVPQSSEHLGTLNAYYGILTFSCAEYAVLLPAHLPSSTFETNRSYYEALLKISPSTCPAVVLHPEDRLLFPECRPVCIKLLPSVQVHSSLDNAETEQEASNPAFRSSPPISAVQETPRARHGRSKAMSATQDNSIPSSNPAKLFNLTDVFSTARDGLPSPILAPEQEPEKSYSEESAKTKDTSQSNGFVAFHVEDSRNSAATLRMDSASNTKPNDKASTPKTAAHSVPNFLSASSQASKSLDSANGEDRVGAENVALEMQKPSEQLLGTAAEDHPSAEAVPDNTPGDDTERSQATGHDADVSKHDESRPESVIRSDGSHESPRIAKAGKSKRAVAVEEHEGLSDPAKRPRTRLRGASATPGTPVNDDASRGTVVEKISPQSGRPDTPASSHSKASSIPGQRTIRVASSNTDILENARIKHTVKSLKIREVSTDKLTGRNFDVLLVSDNELRRTLKLLKALVLGKPIVTEAWVHNCVENFEINEAFSLFSPVGLDPTQERRRIFDGFDIYISVELRKFYKQWDEIRDICLKAGAKKVLSVAASGLDNSSLDRTIFLVTGAKDRDAAVLMKMGRRCHSKDLLSMSILRGHLDLESQEHVTFSPEGV